MSQTRANAEASECSKHESEENTNCISLYKMTEQDDDDGNYGGIEITIRSGLWCQSK